MTWPPIRGHADSSNSVRIRKIARFRMDPTTNLNPDDQLLSPEEIFASQDIDTHDIVVPEWKKADGTPGTIRLKMLSAADLSAYTDAVDGAAKRNAMVIIIMKSAVRADGTPLFREKSDLAR